MIVGGSGIYPFILTEEAGLRVDFTKNEGLKCKTVSWLVFDHRIAKSVADA
jgi:hypothetical protein